MNRAQAADSLSISEHTLRVYIESARFKLAAMNTHIQEHLSGIKVVQLFAREDDVEEAWRIVDPVLRADTPVSEYETGTWGPDGLDATLSPPGGWQNPEVQAS